MAITIMGGLFVATVPTLLVVPALYAMWFRVKIDEPTDAVQEATRPRWTPPSAPDFRCYGGQYLAAIALAPKR